MHPDDDLIVGHIAIEVESEHMAKIRLGLQQLGWKSRKNISVPNPDMAGTPVDQVCTNSTRWATWSGWADFDLDFGFHFRAASAWADGKLVELAE